MALGHFRGFGRRYSSLCYSLAVSVSLAFVPSAWADTPPQTVIFNLTGVSGGVYGNVYTSPYLGNINGGSTIPVICDDFADDSYLPESWHAYDTNLATLPSSTSSSPDDTYLKWGSDANTSLGTTLGLGAGFSLNQTQEYDVAAYLIAELLNPSSGLNSNDLSFAIWGLFDAPAFVYVTGADRTTAETYLKNAIQAVGSPSSQTAYSNVDIYTYVPNSGVWGCNNCQPPPQEFIVVRTPEASTALNLGMDVLAFVGLLGFLRKRAIATV